MMHLNTGLAILMMLGATAPAEAVKRLPHDQSPVYTCPDGSQCTEWNPIGCTCVRRCPDNIDRLPHQPCSNAPSPGFRGASETPAGDIAATVGLLAAIPVLASLLLWLGCGFLAALVASSKRRSVAGWFLLGVLFGPLGLIASAGMATRAEKPERPS